MPLPRLFRLALTLLLALWGWSIQRRPLERGWFVQNVNLAIHEAGHIVFLPFGEFMHFLGGSLFQLLVPLAFAAYFWRRGDQHAATVALWWEAADMREQYGRNSRWTCTSGSGCGGPTRLGLLPRRST